MIFSRRKLSVAAAALLVLGSLLLAACGSASSPPDTASTSTPPSVTSTGSTSTTLGGSVHTTSTTLLFPSQELFMQELSGDGYQTAMVSTDWGEGTIFTIVWIAVDPGKVAPVTTKLFPAVDTMLAWLRLDLNPREGVRLAVGGLREIPSDGLDPRKRLIEAEIIIENRSATPFAYGPDDFRLYVGPFQTQIQGMTASTDFPVRDAVLAPTPVDGHEFMSKGAVAPGDTLHGYLLTWIADRGTGSYGLQYDPSDAEAQKVGGGYMNRIQP